jgi:threonine synthase
MQFSSTRNLQLRTSMSAAFAQGLAADGGLYVPTEWPTLTVQAEAEDLPALAVELLQPLAADDAIAEELPAIASEAFNFPAPLLTLDEARRLDVLELFHGPTAAFKDFGARFLAAALGRQVRSGGRSLQVLVATSGDTGGAVAAAFHRRPGTEVIVLFPEGLVSPTQQQQLTCWGDNVRSFAVRGRFDDCQRLVKQAFADAQLRVQFELSSANSINLGRLLPQMVYYWSASLKIWRTHRIRASFIIPSGNLGNATACVWARKFGAPIDHIVLAHNRNRTVPDYFSEGVLRVRPSVATLSSAMDVGDPSNLERLRALYGDVGSMRAALTAVSIDDEATAARIRADFERYRRIWCPHSAVAAEAFARLPSQLTASGRWVLVATAHPAKFRESIEPLIGCRLPLPESLERLFDRPARFEPLEPQVQSLKDALSL